MTILSVQDDGLLGCGPFPSFIVVVVVILVVVVAANAVTIVIIAVAFFFCCLVDITFLPCGYLGRCSCKHIFVTRLRHQGISRISTTDNRIIQTVKQSAQV